MTKLNIKNVLAMAILACMTATSVAEIAIEEIVVSARKRSENLQEVPIAVTAFTASQIESAGIQRPADFISLMPNVTICTPLADSTGASDVGRSLNVAV